MKQPTCALILILWIGMTPFFWGQTTLILEYNNPYGDVTTDSPLDLSTSDNYFANERWVLNQTSQQQIVWNNQSLEEYAQDIIDSFDLGTWKHHSYTSTIQSTFHSIKL